MRSSALEQSDVSHGSEVDERSAMAQRYATVRGASLKLCQPLSVEDACAQSMPDASPAKWHLAHTSWFFETLVLSARAGYRACDPTYAELFNSYYQQLGTPYPRARRGLLTRPDYAEVLDYRQHVDAAMQSLLDELPPSSPLWSLIELGLQHEQQHQELILTDILHLFSCNPLRPVYSADQAIDNDASQPPLSWRVGPSGVVSIGHDGSGFAFDNEAPRHQVMLAPHVIASRPASNREFRTFIDDDGYRRPELWLSAGWECVNRHRWCRPMYWTESSQSTFSLYGERALIDDAPICHLSFYEADAFARWSGARLPTEAEWEASAVMTPPTSSRLQPGTAGADWFGQVWQWTSSAYQAYPGYKPYAGAVGEYNGKFMSGQMVLRGSSCVTPVGHDRLSYRNFFPPDARWQFSGVRLARDL